MVIHFICRGNVFRSIIAEAYLNSLQIPGVKAVSSGTVAGRDKEKNLIKFPRTWAMLERRGVASYAKRDVAEDLTQAQLDASDIVVCVNDRAYEEAAARFILPQKTYVWDISDIGEKDRIAENDEQWDQYLEDAYDEIVESMDELRSLARF